MLNKKEDAYLFGPFIGELYWECYRFAPYAIHLKKMNPNVKLIVFTRPSRFDLYGKHTDIFVPMNLKHEELYKQSGFNLLEFDPKSYISIMRYFRKKYKNRFEIKGCFFPDIDGWRSQVKWQFPRYLMDYDFQPRNKNTAIVNNYVSDSSSYVVSDIVDYINDYECVDVAEFRTYCKDKIGNKASFIGCLICLIREAEFVVSNLKSFVGKLALLLKIPVISVGETLSDDSIKIINPFDTPVINCRNVQEGVEIYENHFRS